MDTEFGFPEILHTFMDLDQEEKFEDSDYVFRRLRDLEESIYFKLWGSENVVPRDLRLNTIHDDALLAAAGTIAKQGERIKNKFLIKEENSSGIYAVQLFLLGWPLTVVIDETLPFLADNPEQLAFT